MKRGLRRELRIYDDAAIRKQDEAYESKVGQLLTLLEQEATLGVLGSTLDVLLDGREIFKSGDSIQDLIGYLKDDIAYITEGGNE